MANPDRKATLREELESTRADTLRLLDLVPEEFLKRRVHDFYSPVGWHFGHIGMTEEYWVCTRALGAAPIDSDLSFLFANLPDNPKDNRVHLPSREEILTYLAATHTRALAALEATDLDSADPLITDGYAWEFALQHECQHQETIVELLQLIRKSIGPEFEQLSDYIWPKGMPDFSVEMIPIPGGTFRMGSDDRHGYDNEKSAHSVTVAPFALASTPVTVLEWTAFLQDGGYRRPELWTAEGWEWRVGTDAEYPEYWQPTRNNVSYIYFGAAGMRVFHPFEPVCGISWYEADAFARWAGKRLPTEAEWEFAAAFDLEAGVSRRYPWGDERERKWEQRRFGHWHLDGPSAVGLVTRLNSAFEVRDMTDSVWQWTSTPFLPYPGFEAYPYDGYSKDHMDGKHFVCRGGSWATAPRIQRCSFRNWYVPSYRQGILGLRLAKDV